MSENRKVSVIFILLCTFLLGGILGMFLWMALIPICIVYLIDDMKKNQGKEAIVKLSPVDWCIILVCVFEIISCIMSIYLPNSVRRTLPLVLIAFFWFFFKEQPISQKSRTYINLGLSVMGTILSIITIITFFIVKNSLSKYGIEALNDFKQHLTPLNFPVNDWASILLCLLPYPFILIINSRNRNSTLLYYLMASLLVSAILFTLSRSAYIVVALFYLISLGLGLFIYQKNAKSIFVTMVISGTLGCAIAASGYKDILTTCAMTKTTSQIRSNKGRIDLAKNSFKIWKEAPLFGTGGGNFNIAYDNKITDRRTTRSRATNLYMLILVEKGLFGLIAYLFLISVLIARGWKNVKEKQFILFFYAFLIAICVRGFFFSSMFEHRFVMVLISVIAFIVSNDFLKVSNEK